MQLGCLVGSVWGNQHLCMQRQSFLASNSYAGQQPKPQHRFPNQRKPLHWVPTPRKPLRWFIRPGLLHWFCWLDKLPCFLRFSLLFTSKILHVEVSSSIFFKPAFSSHGALRFDRRKLNNINYLAWFRTTWFLLTSHLDSCTSVISGTFWIYCIVSASLLNLCWRSYCNVRLLTEHQARLFHSFKSNKIILGWHFCYH